MQMAQRGLLIAVLLCLLTCGICINARAQEKRFLEQWEQLQTERFMGKLTRTGVCTYEEYMLYYESLNFEGIHTEIWMEEDQKEEDMQGKYYWYPVSWGEIMESLLEEGKYDFGKESALTLCVNRTGRLGTQSNRYCDIVS